MKNISKILGVIILIILTPCCTKENEDSIQDIDGNVYNTVTIGTQVWMKENLRTTKYRNGDIIGTTTPATRSIANEITHKFQWAAGDDESIVESYGRLYTWDAVIDDRKLCPTGWHVPTDADWKILYDYLINNGYGNEETVGKSLAAKSGWGVSLEVGSIGNDQQSNNKTGFTALPSGSRDEFGDGYVHISIGYHCNWWKISENNNSESQGMWMYYGFGSLSGIETIPSVTPPPFSGRSIRCLKD